MYSNVPRITEEELEVCIIKDKIDLDLLTPYLYRISNIVCIRLNVFKDKEDYKHDMILTVIKRIHNFDKSKNKKLYSYIYTMMINTFFDKMRMRKRRLKTISLDRPSVVDV